MNKQIIYQNLQWCVSVSGDLVCVDRNYEISRETLESIDWVNHMKEKYWCNDLYFRQAFEYSLIHTK